MGKRCCSSLWKHHQNGMAKRMLSRRTRGHPSLSLFLLFSKNPLLFSLKLNYFFFKIEIGNAKHEAPEVERWDQTEYESLYKVMDQVEEEIQQALNGFFFFFFFFFFFLSNISLVSNN